MGIRSKAEHQDVELRDVVPAGRRYGKLGGVSGSRRVNVGSVRPIGSWHRMNTRRVQRDGVEQRLAGLRLIAFRITGGQEPLVTPPEVQMPPVDGVPGRTAAQRD